MTNQNLISEIEKYLFKLRNGESNIDEYYNKELRKLSNRTKLAYLITICKLFETDEQRNRRRRVKEEKLQPIKNVDVNQLTTEYINDFLKCEWFNNLSNKSKNHRLIAIKKYLKYSDRKDLVKAIGKKRFKEEKKVLSKTDLITRDDLELILKHCCLKVRTLLMVMYEGVLIRYMYINYKRCL
ncbi:MAG: hypothetical protein ACFFAQ_10265 [Promethearchaeota archaeon]